MIQALIRPARSSDVSDMALLANMAGHGLPAWLWSSDTGGEFATAMEVGRARARRDTGSFSWRNARIAEVGGQVAGLLVGYRQPDESEEADLDGIPEPIHPLIELEALAPATWYINMMSVFAEFRRVGAGSLLLKEAETVGEIAAAKGLSLIVEDTNEAARSLYFKYGFRDADSRPFLSFPGGPDASRWMLMTKLF